MLLVLKPLKVLQTLQLGTFIFLMCRYLIGTMKARQRLLSDLILIFSDISKACSVNSLAFRAFFSFKERKCVFYWRTEPPVFSITLKNSVQGSQNKSHMKGKETSWRERLEKHTELHQHFNF